MVLGEGAVSCERSTPLEGTTEGSKLDARQDCPGREKEFFIDNLLVRIHSIIEMILVNDFSKPALHHESLNSPFQVALYLPS